MARSAPLKAYAVSSDIGCKYPAVYILWARSISAARELFVQHFHVEPDTQPCELHKLRALRADIPQEEIYSRVTITAEVANVVEKGTP